MVTNDLIHQLRTSGRTVVPVDRAARVRRVVLEAADRQAFNALAHETPPAHSRWRPLLVTALVMVVLVLGLGTSAAANAAKPGDWLYGVDRAAEQLRLALTFNATAKAAYETQVAEERLHEQNELEVQHSTHAIEASANAGAALNQAITTVDHVQQKLEGKSGKSAATLQRVEAKLRELKQRRELSNQPKESEDDRASAASEPSSDAADDDASTERQNGSDDDESDRNDEANQPVNMSTSIRVRVNVEDNRADIQTIINGQEQEWTLSSTTKSDIAASIAAKTGLTISAVMASWDYETE